MALDKSKLLEEFKKFGEPEFSGFLKYPVSLNEVKTKWSEAFNAYLSEIEVISPVTVEPVNTQAVVTDAVATAFAAELNFESSTSLAVTIKNIVDAWEKAVQAVQLVAAGTYNGNKILSIVPLPTSAGRPSLQSDLERIFTGYDTDNLGRLTEITTALHDATVLALQTTCTYQNTAPTPPVLTGPLVFG